MSSLVYQTVVVPVGLGDASSFNREIFPLSSYRKRDSLGRADLFLDASLEEMIKITKIGSNPQQWQDIIDITKARYDQLSLQKAQLERQPKTKNPFKIFANYRAARLFLAATKSFYLATKSRSEEVIRTVGRSLLSVPGGDVEPANGDVPSSAPIAGIAVKLDRPLDDIMKQQILDAANTIASCPIPFEGDEATSATSSFLSDEYVLASESLSSLLSDTTEETADDTLVPPTSPTTINNFYTFYGSVYSPGSNLYGATVQIGGSNNSGTVIETVTAPSVT